MLILELSVGSSGIKWWGLLSFHVFVGVRQTMESEEAQKALNLARKHDLNGNKDAALKWARKSVSIYSTPEATTLVSRLETVGTQGTPSSSAKPSELDSETTYTSTTTTTTSSQAQGEKQEYTQTQVEIVRRVKRAGGDFYSVLQVEKTAQDSDIKKAYKKVGIDTHKQLALQLHPDKNRAPGADEAFKCRSRSLTASGFKGFYRAF